MFAVERALEGRGEGSGGQVIHQHRGPGQRLEKRPVQAYHAGQCQDYQKFCQSPEHEIIILLTRPVSNQLLRAQCQAKNQLTKNKSHRVTPFWHNDTRSRVTVTFGARRRNSLTGPIGAARTLRSLWGRGERQILWLTGADSAGGGGRGGRGTGRSGLCSNARTRRGLRSRCNWRAERDGCIESS